MTRDDYGKAYQRSFDQTVRFLSSRGITDEYAREAAQAAWAKGWEMRAQLRDESLITVWVNSIALNYHRRMLRRQPQLQILPELPGGIETNMAALDLACILKFMSGNDRLLLERLLQGASIHEIAKDHRVTETAIRVRLLRARRAVRARIEEFAMRLSSNGAACQAA